MKNMPKTARFFIVVLLQLFIMTGVIIYHRNLAKGFKVLLRIGPVDPSSPIRGDYLVLNYSDISTIKVSEFDYHPVKTGDLVYVSLKRKNRFWIIAEGNKISKRKPFKGIFIKGVIKRGENTTYSSTSVGLTYGIESYYIPPGSGRGIKSSRNDFAEVSIGKDGSSSVIRTYINNRPFPYFD